MAIITFIIIVFWWNPQKLITYYFDDCSKTIQEIKQQKKTENVN